MNGKLKLKMDSIKEYLSKISTLPKRAREASILCPSSVPLSVTEDASISLNMPKYLWKCLNKLFWLCLGSEYTWSSNMLDRLLEMSRVLNKPGVWIWHGWICQGYTEFGIYLIMAPYASIMPEYASICLNIPHYAWSRLSIAECPWMSLKMLE